MSDIQKIKEEREKIAMLREHTIDAYENSIDEAQKNEYSKRISELSDRLYFLDYSIYRERGK